MTRFSSTVSEGKEPPAFGHERNTAREAHMRRQVADWLVGEHDRIAARRDKPGDGLQQRALAGAVGADDRDHLSRDTSSDTPKSAWKSP
jgi:hypothetical protein